jgi:hypothetical protein
MTVIFKNCGTVDIDGLQRMLQPIIDQMEADPSFTQFGFKKKNNKFFQIFGQHL